MKQAYCKIVDGEVVDQQLFAQDCLPDEELWLPIVVETPDYDRRTHREVGRVNRVEADRVVRERVIEPIPVTVEMIKAEAQRRIIERVGATDLTHCLVKQLNATMRANELNAIRHDRDWTETEAAEAATLKGLADAIKVIRAKSNEIEASLPADFRSDRLWA